MVCLLFAIWLLSTLLPQLSKPVAPPTGKFRLQIHSILLLSTAALRSVVQFCSLV